MKLLWRLSILVMLFFTSSLQAYDLSGANQHYLGKIASVNISSWGQVMVELQAGDTCMGQTVVALNTANGFYSEIYKALIFAQATQSDVHFFNITGQVFEPAPGIRFCQISEASLGKASQWPVSN